MIADDVAAVLPELRAQAESMMVDSCVVTRGGSGGWDDASGTYTPDPGATVYTGRCRVRMPSAGDREADAGETSWTLRGAVVSLPVAGSEGVRVGDVVTVTAATFDAALLGDYAVVGLHAQTHATARRLKCEAVDRDAQV